jgi:hypothetical protein
MLDEAEVQRAVTRAMQEIVRDTQAGILPPEVRDFSTLHDYVDANGYGGFFEEEYQDVSIEFVAEVQDRVNTWLEHGGAILPTMTVAQLRAALEGQPGDRYVIAFGAMDYLNIKGVEDPDEEDSALVLNLSDDFDTRQW